MTGMLSGYRKDWFRSDAVAGVTAAAVVIPKSMAIANIAGLPMQAGLYVALVPMFVYALLGSSRLLSVSSTSTIAILTATDLALAVPDGDPAHLMTAAATLTVLVGGFLTVAGLLRLGFLANFISDPVLTGFKAGLGIRYPNFWACTLTEEASCTRFCPPYSTCRRQTAQRSFWPPCRSRFFSLWSGFARRLRLPWWLLWWGSLRRDFLA